MSNSNKRISKKRESEIKQAFKKIDTIIISTEFGPIELISLDELPMSQMSKFMRAPNEERMLKMVDFLELCTINPGDWDKIADLSVRQLNRIIQQWMGASTGMDGDNDELG